MFVVSNKVNFMTLAFQLPIDLTNYVQLKILRMTQKFMMSQKSMFQRPGKSPF